MGGMRIGRIRGIPVSVNPSVLVVLALLTWSLAEEQLPELVAGESRLTYWLAGAIGALLFLLSLLAHEGAHAVVATHEGVTVSGVSLWLFGGMAFLEGEAPTARSDMRIALAGPVTSLLLALGFGIAAIALGALDAAEIVVAAMEWLAIINLVLALFNLVPGAPLDGGRVLRAHLWHRSGDRYRAAITATTAGRVVGIVLIVLGVVEVVIGLAASGLWLAFIGWFIHSVAGQEHADAIVRRDLRDLRVVDAMQADPALTIAARTGRAPVVTVAADDALIAVRDRMAAAGVESAIVEDAGVVVGVVTMRAIGRAAKLRPRRAALATRVPPKPPPPPWHGVITGRR
jgi:Zn-dependent protease